MRTLSRIAGFALCIALHFMWSAPARAAFSGSDTTTAATDSTRTAADSTKAAADSTKADSAAADTMQVPVDRFIATSVSRVESDDISVSMGSRLNAAIDAGRGWKFNHDISMERRRYRQRAMEDITEQVLNKAENVRPGWYKLGMQVGENYSKKKTLGLGRFGQDIVFDNTEASFEFALLKPILKSSSSNLSITGDGRKGTNDFKYDRAYSGSASGMLKYSLGGLLTVMGGAGTNARRETSNIGPMRFGPMRSSADSLRAGLSFGRSMTKTVDVSYSWVKGVDRKVMPPLGNTYEILADPSLAKREEARNRAEQLLVSTSLKPFSFLSLSTNFTHSKATQKYQVDTRLSMESEENAISATARYAYAARGTLQFDVSTSEALSDYGPVSLSSFRERQQVLRIGIEQKLGDSISVSMSGSGTLQQRFYLKQTVNPRDADYLDYRGTFSLKAPHRKFGAEINGSIERFETINIDNTLSGDNRIDYKYQVGPRLSLSPAAWLYLTQDYIVKIDFTDFVFTEDKNYLNRTTSLNTRARFDPFRSLKFDILHSYLKKDTGSYLMRAGGRRYSPSNETFEHALEITTTYNVVEDLFVKAEGDFRIQTSNVIGSLDGRRIVTSTTVYESGGMRLGFAKTMRFGERGGISLDVAHVRNYGPYITRERKEYWEADAELTLKF